MKDQATVFQRVMEKYRFQEPVPLNIQGDSFLNRRKLLIKILKASGKYSVVYGLSLRLYFGFRRFGLKISAGNCLAVTYALSAIIVSALAAGIIYTSLPDASTDQKRNDTIPVERNENIIPENRKAPDGNVKPFTPAVLSISEFTAENVDPETAAKVTDTVADELRSVLGRDAVSSGGKLKTGRIVMGSVGKIGSLYLLTARLVDVESGKIIFTTSERVSGSAGIPYASRKVAEQIYQNLDLKKK